MADRQIKTTSSKSLDGKLYSRSASTPKDAEKVQLLTKLANNLSESYQIVKQRQHKYNQLTNMKSGGSTPKLLSPSQRTVESKVADDSEGALHGDGDGNGDRDGDGEWQEVCSAKNKLKRKKKLSASLTSVTDSVNQEKRTRIEGIQLNCRGRLQLREPIMLPSGAAVAATNPPQVSPKANNNSTAVASKGEKLQSKPPLPPTTSTTAGSGSARTQGPHPQNGIVVGGAVPPPRLRRKLQENIQTIQKLNTLTEQLRLEINELKSNLTTERGAVRVLRAQNEAETRKWKNEVKKLQNAVELSKKNNATLPINNTKKINTESIQPNGENQPSVGGSGGLVNYEIQRLTNEIIMLREANRALEDKKVINCDADRRKAADMRTLKDSYEIRLTQLTKSAKTEISRLLEEIKTKDRNIGQIKKDLQVLQNKTQNDIKSRNATTQPNSTTTTTKTTNNQQKPKKTNNPTIKTKQNNEIQQKNRKAEIASPPEAHREETNKKDPTSSAQNPNEMKKLKDIELINNTRNLQNNVNLKTTSILTNTQTNQQNSKFLETNCNDNENDENFSNNLLKTAPTTKEYHSMSHETDRLLATSEAPSVKTRTRISGKTEGVNNDLHEYRTGKDHNNSDSDSAVSSAPPSISPQPPPAGLETGDIWQMIRNYTTDIEKLQKDIDVLQKENAELHTELNMAKEQILTSEKQAMEMNNNGKIHELMDRIKYLEEQEHDLQAETNELREQNELLEFRIIELEETNDKWSLQSHAAPTAAMASAHQTASTTSSSLSSSSSSSKSSAGNLSTVKDVWGCAPTKSTNRDDPMQMLFGNSRNLDSGILSPISRQHHVHDDENDDDDDDDVDFDMNSNEELRQRIGYMLKKTALDDVDRQCLQQVLMMVQQMDIISTRSGPNSLNTTASSDEASSLDMVKSRISDYSSASSSSSARSAYDNVVTAHHPKSSKCSNGSATTNSRIVATVQPYNSSPSLQQQHQQQQTVHVPTNTPTDSPRKSRHSWQSNSLSESGVFVESDFLSDAASEHNVCTQTDFEDELENGHQYPHHHHQHTTKEFCSELHKLQRYDCCPSANTNTNKVPAPNHQPSQSPTHLNDQKRLQYYKDRLELLESKVLIYESSGDLQAKRLADRLQREIQLEKELHELQDRVEFLEGENSTLEEEKCEFEEAENDTRLRLQRLEVELEILSQRNVELEMSREALSAKYKDCRSECLILRDDLGVSETQIRHLEEDKQKAKENFEFLHSILPLLIAYSGITNAVQQQVQSPLYQDKEISDPLASSIRGFCQSPQFEMGNIGAKHGYCGSPDPFTPFERNESIFEGRNEANPRCSCQSNDMKFLKDEVKSLRNQIKELNGRHYEAMESADSHWLDLEREYKDREEAFRNKENCLKQKINKLQDCLRDDSRAANEKILQMEESEKELKSCLLRVTKEYRDISTEHEAMSADYEHLKLEMEQMKEQHRPLTDAMDLEKKRNKSLVEELAFMRKLQAESESRNIIEMEALRTQIYDLKKDYLHIEVTNSELKEEVATLEQQIETMRSLERKSIDKIHCLQDEIRTKEEMCEKLEKRLERSDGYSLADELNSSPSKRFKRENVMDLKTASKGLGHALRSMESCENTLPSHHQFEIVARDVKKLADSLLSGGKLEEEILQEIEELINEQLMQFHSRRMESEFYCTVYYPVKRTVPVDINDFIIK